MFIHTLHTTYSFEGVVAEIKAFRSRQYGQDQLCQAIRTLNKEEKQRLWINLYGKVGLSLKRSSAWQNFIS